MLDTELEDSRRQTDPLPLQTIALDTGMVTAQFVKFELVSWWGNGGGLQYFHIIRAGIILTTQHNLNPDLYKSHLFLESLNQLL